MMVMKGGGGKGEVGVQNGKQTKMVDFKKNIIKRSTLSLFLSKYAITIATN